jgi:hypothetical protein
MPFTDWEHPAAIIYGRRLQHPDNPGPSATLYDHRQHHVTLCTLSIDGGQFMIENVIGADERGAKQENMNLRCLDGIGDIRRPIVSRHYPPVCPKVDAESALDGP